MHSNSFVNRDPATEASKIDRMMRRSNSSPKALL